MKKKDLHAIINKFCYYLMDENNGVIHTERIDMFLDQEFPEEENVTSLKEQKIAYIKRIIAEHGCFTIADVEAESSPCISSVGNDKNVSGDFFSTMNT